MLSACLFACASGHAATASSPPSPATLQQLALDTVHTGMSQEQYLSIMRAVENAMIDTMEKQAVRENRKLPRAAHEFVAEILRQYFSYEAACASLAEFYSRRFTEAELRQIAAYQRTATYQKQIGLMPEMMQYQAREVQHVFDEHREEIKAKIAARLRAASDTSPAH